MDEKIEKFLKLSKTEIEKRKEIVLEQIPSYPGIKYLEQRLKKFGVQPWPFISYLAHWAPEKLKHNLECYRDYDGSENSQAIMEQLREKYIMYKVLSDLQKKHPDGC